MTRPQVADGEAGLQIWKVVANILKKQSRTAGNGWSSSLVVSVGLTTHRKNRVVTKCHKEPGTWTDFLDKRLKVF
jgi:hypothetical protein